MRPIRDAWAPVRAALPPRGPRFPNPQRYLDAAGQLAFARHFGEIEILVPGLTTIPIPDEDEHGKFHAADSHRMKLLRGTEGWHTDSSDMPLAAKDSVPSAHVLPREGGGTAWADARAAYAALDDAMRRRLEGLNAYHSYFHSQRKIGHEVAVGAGYGSLDGEPPLRPMVKVHPESGRRYIFLGRHAGSIPGPSDAEAKTACMTFRRKPWIFSQGTGARFGVSFSPDLPGTGAGGGRTLAWDPGAGNYRGVLRRPSGLFRGRRRLLPITAFVPQEAWMVHGHDAPGFLRSP